MADIDAGRTFVPLRIAVLTVSDTRTAATDASGEVLASRITAAGHTVASRTIVRDERECIIAALRSAVADPAIDVVISTGGTGVTGRDVTPEAVQAVMDKEIPGFGELFRQISFRSIGTATIQSRAIGAVAGGTYIFALPGSPGACAEAWDGILLSQLDSRYRPCNFVDLMPRLTEHQA